MSVRSLARKVLWYHKKHGWVRLTKLFLAKATERINRKEYMYLLDLNTIGDVNPFLEDGIVVESFTKASDIPPNDMEQLVKLKSDEILSGFLSSFFDRGATIWLAKKDGRIVSLLWSKIGGFNGFWMGHPICPNDAILVAGETFPEFRGRNYFAMMIRVMCGKLKEAGISRAYGAAHINNRASQKSQSKVWKRIGAVRYFGVFKWYVAIWDKNSVMMDFRD